MLMRIRSISVISLLVLASCATTTNSADLSDYLSQNVQWQICPDDYFLKKDYRFSDFDKDNVTCAEIEVPISYDDLSLGSKTVAMMGMGSRADQVVFYNPGGPGASGIEAIQTIDFPDVLDQEYFIIGFDPRGVGFSSPVRCDDEADLESYYKFDLYIESQAEADEFIAADQKFTADCAAANPYWWTITTENTVQDIELMRAVLTDQPLNFIGSSYGTTLAMEYLRAYPENIGKVMLDSPVLIGLDNDEDSLQQGKGFNDSFERLFAECAADAKCPGNSVMEVAELIKQKLIAADDGKVLGYWGVQQSSLSPDATVASANMIMDGLSQMSYFELDDVYSDFREGMIELIEKNDSWIFEFYGLLFNGYDPETKERSNMSEILYIVNCLDIDSRDFDSLDELKEFDKKYQAAAPLVHYLYTPPNGFIWSSARQGCEWSWLAFDDDSIPDPPAKVPGPVNESGKQILIIASQGDNATPYVGAVKVARQLKSPLVTFTGTGHAIAFNGNTCLKDQITNFFGTSGSLASVSCDPE
jgi:pimeloyl-ACP methyl ester carboxylesterase